MSEAPIKAVIVGAGNRGTGYSNYALSHPEALQIIGVVDPSALRRKVASEKFKIPSTQVFKSVSELLEKPKIADVVINGTMDLDHVSTSLPLLSSGYDILLEKPFATSETEMWELIKKSRQHKRKLMICHVLRYSPFYRKIKERVADGQIGTIINIQTNEHVSYHHMAVAFVRGKWRSKLESGSSMLMAKCCHDLDLIMWMKSGINPKTVASFGSNKQFRPENAPPGAGTRCLVDCTIESDCLYSARKHYIDKPDRWKFYVWESDVFNNILYRDRPTQSDRIEQLKSSDYGRCVWDFNNDIVDHQSVIIEFEDGSTATHNMVGGSARPARNIHILGTTGEILGVFEDSKFVVRKIDPGPNRDYSEEIVDLNIQGDIDGSHGGHGGGDQRLIEDFVRFVKGYPPSISCSSIEDSINSHLVGFKADQSMEERRIVTIETSF